MKPKTKQISEKERVYELMQNETPGTDEYNKLLSVYKTLCEMEAKKHRITPDAWLASMTNLLGIGLILKHEELHVIATKAMNFVVKGRL